MAAQSRAQIVAKKILALEPMEAVMGKYDVKESRSYIASSHGAVCGIQSSSPVNHINPILKVLCNVFHPFGNCFK